MSPPCTLCAGNVTARWTITLRSVALISKKVTPQVSAQLDTPRAMRRAAGSPPVPAGQRIRPCRSRSSRFASYRGIVTSPGPCPPEVMWLLATWTRTSCCSGSVVSCARRQPAVAQLPPPRAAACPGWSRSFQAQFHGEMARDRPGWARQILAADTHLGAHGHCCIERLRDHEAVIFLPASAERSAHGCGGGLTACLAVTGARQTINLPVG
jgi:hypothetical protein